MSERARILIADDEPNLRRVLTEWFPRFLPEYVELGGSGLPAGDV